MKTALYILTVSLLAALFSCDQAKERKKIAAIATDTLKISLDKKEKDRLERRRKIEEQNYAESIRIDKVLEDALKIANQNIGKKRFIEKYQAFPDSFPVSVEINLDHHFTKTYPHLIIHRNDPGVTYIDIYSKGAHAFEKVLSHEQWALTYVSDTIRDINGDGLKDFVVNWYGSSGCCLKAFSNIYLLRPGKKTFSNTFEFINPTFSPNEKIIRGVCYGHPGETEMYKYKWNGETVDTLEYVSYQRNDKGIKTGKVVLSTRKSYNEKSRMLRVLNSVPAEYRKIEGYDWFKGNY